MVFENLTVTRFGIFQEVEVIFSKDKINIIQGENGCGKTTILAILYSMLQDNEILHYHCEESEAVIKLKIIDQKDEIWVNKRYRNKDYEITVKSFDEMKKLLSIDRGMVYLLGGSSIYHKTKLNSEMISNANQLLDEIGIENKYKVDLSETKSYNIMSGGVQTYYWILNILYNTPPGSILLMDDPFAMLDYDTADYLLTVMGKMKSIQFILTGSLRMDVPEDCNQIILEIPRNSTKSCERVQFDYFKLFDDSIEVLTDDRKVEKVISDERPIIKYELGKKVEEVEKRNVEFKEIKGDNPCNTIVDTAEIYINAFLNSKVVGLGIIKWGISDEGIVTGVKLSDKDRDIINKKVSERIGQMKPYVSTESIRISYEEVVYNNEIVNDLYVVEILVEPVYSKMLFATSKNEIYIKTDGGKRKLDAIQIQEEFQRRKG